MQRKIAVTLLAQVEFEEGVAWYERRSEGLGERFAQAIRKKYEQILENPNAYRIPL